MIQGSYGIVNHMQVIGANNHPEHNEITDCNKWLVSTFRTITRDLVEVGTHMCIPFSDTPYGKGLT